jgi:WD40 repeat protein
MWDKASGRELRTFVGHTSEVNGCAISPDGTWIVSASSDKTLRVWDAATGKERQTLTGHNYEVTGCAVSPDGAWIISVSHDQTLRVWNATTGRERLKLQLPGALLCVALHPSQPVAACGDEPGRVYLVDLVGIEYGPLFVTATPTKGLGLVVRCPMCQNKFVVESREMGGEFLCRPGCGTLMKINLFVTHAAQPAEKEGWFSRLRKKK